GVVGLGTATLAAYAERGDVYRLYEINPAVVRLADRYFTFLADARQRGASIECFLGDARLVLERQTPQQFDVLTIDAFTGDAVPAHLLTVEAFALYLNHLAAPDGVIAVHVSNIHLDLTRVVQAVAQQHDLDAVSVESSPDGSPVGSLAVWVLLARRGSAVLAIPTAKRLADSVPGDGVLWTDDVHSLVDVLR
ncbi:MAG TPA: fused MFS/spermidine synthase, partial [Lacipirellulaceae bacterium]|nr:fused MFS/spermidine synthase [Lacipirellulaceae bacterium]